MVVIYPDVKNILRENVYYGIYQDVERRLSESLGMPVVSGYRAFLNDKDARQNMAYSLVDDHPSCKAHEAGNATHSLSRWSHRRTAEFDGGHLMLAPPMATQ
jgi:hypothetical protein